MAGRSRSLDPVAVPPRHHPHPVSGVTYHGLRRKHFPSYLDEFVYRFNRRRDRAAAFPALLGFAAAQRPATYDMLISLGAEA